MTRRGAIGAVGAGVAGAAAAVPADGPVAGAGHPPLAGVSRHQAERAVAAAVARFRGLDRGARADYIPALAAADPDLFGLALTLADGHVIEAGDSRVCFSLQSISKVFTCALVMQESGPERIVDSVGVDATGRVFNSIDAIEQHRGREMNPLVNAGAIATTGNVIGEDPDDVWAKILGIHCAFAGRTLSMDSEVYASEAATNERNRAIGTLMHAYERFPMDPLVATDLYTRQCAIAVSARDLAIMAACFAFGGRNPVTSVQVMDAALVPGLLAIMATSGLYDDSGKWLFRTGCPAKSGVGGGLLAVSPGRFGIAAFSPLLDEAGNSVRAQEAIADVVQALDANPLARFA